MSKILVEVCVPAAGSTNDLFIPYEMKMSEVAERVKAVFADQNGPAFEPVADTILCDRVTGAIFNVNLSPQEIGLQNGAKLLLL